MPHSYCTISFNRIIFISQWLSTVIYWEDKPTWFYCKVCKILNIHPLKPWAGSSKVNRWGRSVEVNRRWIWKHEGNNKRPLRDDQVHHTEGRLPSPWGRTRLNTTIQGEGIRVCVWWHSTIVVYYASMFMFMSLQVKLMRFCVCPSKCVYVYVYAFMCVCICVSEGVFQPPLTLPVVRLHWDPLWLCVDTHTQQASTPHWIPRTWTHTPSRYTTNGTIILMMHQR